MSSYTYYRHSLWLKWVVIQQVFLYRVFSEYQSIIAVVDEVLSYLDVSISDVATGYCFWAFQDQKLNVILECDHDSWYKCKFRSSVNFHQMKPGCF